VDYGIICKASDKVLKSQRSARGPMGKVVLELTSRKDFGVVAHQDFFISLKRLSVEPS